MRALLLALLLLAPLAVAATVEEHRYLIGQAARLGRTGFDQAGVDETRFTGVCGRVVSSSIVNPLPAPGGACDLLVTPGEQLDISVVDDVLGPGVGFQVRLTFASGVGTPNGNRECAPWTDHAGPSTLVVPVGCERVSVFVAVGGTAGTITIMRS